MRGRRHSLCVRQLDTVLKIDKRVAIAADLAYSVALATTTGGGAKERRPCGLRGRSAANIVSNKEMVGRTNVLTAVAS